MEGKNIKALALYKVREKSWQHPEMAAAENQTEALDIVYSQHLDVDPRELSIEYVGVVYVEAPLPVTEKNTEKKEETKDES